MDNEHGAFMAVDYLVKAGHTHIGFISGDISRLSFKQRLDGYKKALRYHRIPPHDELICTGGMEKGYDHVHKLLKLKMPPTAIFAANDINAHLGYRAVADAGYKIPDDISLIGFDDIDLSKMVSPPLTTIRAYKEEMGSIAVRTLLKILDSNIDNKTTSVVPVKLVERKSVNFMNKQYHSN